VQDEVAFGLENLGFPPDLISERVSEALSAVGLQDRADSFLSELSGGQKQRVAIAAVLVMQPRVLVFDEPTSDQDAPGKQRVATLLKKLQQDRRATIIVVEHDLSAVGPVADRLVIMNEGKIVANDRPSKILEDKNRQLQGFGFRFPLLSEAARPGPERPKPAAPGKAGRNADRTVLRVDNVNYAYQNGRQALTGVSLELKAGEFLAVAGQNGSGKSTLAYLLAGFYHPQQGRITVDGQLYSQLKAVEMARKIGLLFQNPDNQLFCATVEEEVRFGLKNFQLAEKKEATARLLSKLGLASLAGRHPQAISRGQRQRVALAAVLALQPAVLVLDEPSTGQDWEHLQSMMGLLEELREQGTGILVISHNWEAMTSYADRMIVLEQGQVIFSGDPGDGLAYSGL
jgi:energy-coupling factor transport system ATP-binding protein